MVSQCMVAVCQWRGRGLPQHLTRYSLEILFVIHSDWGICTSYVWELVDLASRGRLMLVNVRLFENLPN